MYLYAPKKPIKIIFEKLSISVQHTQEDDLTFLKIKDVKTLKENESTSNLDIKSFYCVCFLYT